jgi:ribosomal protein S12 methylthiotransferase
MPLQHVTDRMLASMRRGTTKKKTTELIKEIRSRVPGIALRTTLIAGYPGETEADHREVLDWVQETRFDRLGVFPYSHEEDTHAYTLKDDVPAEGKKERAEAVMAVQQGISAQINQGKVGKTFKTLFDRKEGDFFVGRTEHDSPEVDNEVLVDAKKFYVRLGDFAPVRVTSAEEFDLFGDIA